MKLAAAALACLVLASCGGGEPSVDWSQVPQNQRHAIAQAVAANDCRQMQTYFDGSERSDVLRYLDWHLRDARCYD